MTGDIFDGREIVKLGRSLLLLLVASNTGMRLPKCSTYNVYWEGCLLRWLLVLVEEEDGMRVQYTRWEEGGGWDTYSKRLSFGTWPCEETEINIIINMIDYMTHLSFYYSIIYSLYGRSTIH